MIYKKDNVEKIAADKATAAKLEQKGFVCIAGEKEAPEMKSEQAPVVDLKKLTVQELRSMAKDRGIKGAGALSKGDLIQVLQ